MHIIILVTVQCRDEYAQIQRFPIPRRFALFLVQTARPHNEKGAHHDMTPLISVLPQPQCVPLQNALFGLHSDPLAHIHLLLTAQAKNARFLAELDIHQ